MRSKPISIQGIAYFWQRVWGPHEEHCEETIYLRVFRDAKEWIGGVTFEKEDWSQESVWLEGGRENIMQVLLWGVWDWHHVCLSREEALVLQKVRETACKNPAFHQSGIATPVHVYWGVLKWFEHAPSKEVPFPERSSQVAWSFICKVGGTEQENSMVRGVVRLWPMQTFSRTILSSHLMYALFSKPMFKMW